MKLASLSICVIAHNARGYIRELISQIQSGGAAAGIPLDIAVIDNNSTDGTQAIVEGLTPVRLIQNQVAGNVSVSRNIGIRDARYAYCWFFDDDSIMTDEAFVSGCSLLERHEPDVLIPIIINENGIPNNCKKKFGKRIDFSLPASDILRNSTSSFVLNTVVARKKVAYFDERIPFMWEDVEYFLRLKRLGMRFFYTHDLRVGHRVKSFGQKLSNRMGYLFYLQTRHSITIYKRLDKNQIAEFNDFCPGGTIVVFMVLSFFVACGNYNFWADFYDPSVMSLQDRLLRVFQPARHNLDKSFVHSLYYFFKGVIDGIRSR